MRIKPDDIKKGTIFYESAYGQNVQYEALHEPHTVEVVIGEDQGPRTQWHWQAKNLATQEITDFTVTAGMEHYGPQIYSEPAYYCP